MCVMSIIMCGEFSVMNRMFKKEVCLEKFQGCLHISKREGFTLAEVLITLGIIGIVAAMTLPTLMQKYREKQVVTALNTAYTMFSQSFLRATEEFGTPDTWGFSQIERVDYDDGTYDYNNEKNAKSGEILYNNLTKNLKVIKKCLPGDYSCYKPVTAGSLYSGILANGMSFSFIPRAGACDWVKGSGKLLSTVCADITIDIDGPNKGENAWGKDTFRFHMSKYGLLPIGTSGETGLTFENHCRYSEYNAVYGGIFGEACAAWVIYNGNMDYLHCDGLSWNKKRKCK